MDISIILGLGVLAVLVAILIYQKVKERRQRALTIIETADAALEVAPIIGEGGLDDDDYMDLEDLTDDLYD